ncbi:MAG: TlpA family protein disulfide reductase [Proteobacteria bacterium]|nr:TlpA family protein disulfide reductase [Pseudomonadota bacterium]MBU1737003.1 TlpA family protein disulfide reductase [Pseudomonadota bacterium]
MRKIIGIFITVPVLALVLIFAGCGQQEQERPQVATVGLPAPDFILLDTRGKSWKLSELKGHVVFVNFWATWCPPCRQEMPSMQELYMSMPADKFKMLSILSNDEPVFADKLAAKIGCTFPVMDDPDSAVGKAYGITGVPETYIVDKKGILREKFLGPREWGSPEARYMLYKYLKE